MVGPPEGYGLAVVLIGTSVNAFIALIPTDIAGTNGAQERRRPAP